MDANGNFIDNPALNKEYDAIAREEYDSMATDEARRELALDLPAGKKGRALRMRRIARNFIPRYTENALREFDGRGPDPLSMPDTYVPIKKGIPHGAWLGLKWGVIGVPWLLNLPLRALGRRNRLHTPEGVVPLYPEDQGVVDALGENVQDTLDEEGRFLSPETKESLKEVQETLQSHPDPHTLFGRQEVMPNEALEQRRLPGRLIDRRWLFGIRFRRLGQRPVRRVYSPSLSDRAPRMVAKANKESDTLRDLITLHKLQALHREQRERRSRP